MMTLIRSGISNQRTPARRRAVAKRIACAAAIVVGVGAQASAKGVSPYLPLHLSPEIERQIEYVLLLADRPMMSRPIPAAAVLEALPEACKKDESACNAVRAYLRRYMRRLGLTHASLEATAGSESSYVLPNERGRTTDSAWYASARGFWQPSDYAIVTLGAVGHDEEIMPSGSMLSVGTHWAQLDVGYREHWLSPFSDSSMLMSTQAAALPSITLSNYEPLTSLGLRYELFAAEMDYSDRIAFGEGFTAGEPRLVGLHLSAQPAPGWAISANRVLQFGGGARGGQSASDVLRAFFRPDRYDNRNAELTQDEEFGNQIAAWSSEFIFPGEVPFSVYLTYAGEDRSYEGNYRLGNAALQLGVSFPRLWDAFALTYEVSEWQNGWYVNSLYGHGFTEDGHVLGHWGADQRTFADDVGAQAHMLRLEWEPSFGGFVQLRLRTLENEDYGASDYHRAHEAALQYSRTFGGMTGGAELMGGRDVFGDNFTRLSGFVRFGDEWAESPGSWWTQTKRPHGAELFVDAGVNSSRVQIRLGDGSPNETTSAELGPHVAIGARRAVSARSDLGVRLELDRVNDQLLLAVRALDYRYRFRNPLAVSIFAGAARYDLATPAFGYYFGLGAQWREVLPHMDLSLDLRYADKVARDKLLPSDPRADPRPDTFYDVTSAALSLSYKF